VIKIKLCLLSLVLLLASPVWGQENAFQGMFIWSLDEHPVLESASKIEEAVGFAKQHGIKVLFVQVYRSNQAWFPSKYADSSPYYHCFKSVGQDPLNLLISKAHAQGIEVHAWLNLLSLGANANAPILKKYGSSILTSNKDEKRSLEDYKIDRQFFLEPGDPRVRQYIGKTVLELLRAYPRLDGIQFDYIRYPDVHPHYGYTRLNMQRFKRAARQKDIIETSPVWQQWKRDQVTGLLSRLVQMTRSLSPHIHISTTGCLSYIRAHDEAFQDWPFWINSGLVEFVTVMNYPPDAATFEKNIKGIKPYVQDFKKVNIAVGAYKRESTRESFGQQWEICLQSGVKGCVLFHYGNLQEEPALAAVLNK
jgi:uncharacterized lipoprotein YddW (UPF0748 family)